MLDKGYQVFGLIRGQNKPKFDLVRRVIPDVTLLTGDLTDLSSLLRALNVEPDEFYNLGVDVACAAAGIADWKPYVHQDPAFVRPAEVELLIGDPGKAKDRLGWSPTVSFEQLVTMMVENHMVEQKALAGRSA